MKLFTTALLALFWASSAGFSMSTGYTPTTVLSDRVDSLSLRAVSAMDALVALEMFYLGEIKPVEEFIARRNPKDAKKISWILVIHARKHNIPTELALSILLVENPQFNPRARSSAGAMGLTQVMPFHRGNWACGNKSLYDIETNICTGLKIYSNNLKEARGDTRKALLAYNGCVHGTRTPNCKQYPDWISQKIKIVKSHFAR